MVSTSQHPSLTPQAYFEWEAQQELRYEYFDGDVFAMAGGSLPHADIALNIASLLRSQLRGGCKVRNSDAKVGITDNGPFVYPDVSVSCDERVHEVSQDENRTAQKFSRYPCLIVEVISPGTEAYDRGGKFALYRRLKTLQEYVLVGSESKTVEIFRRDAEGTWAFIPHQENDEIQLMSTGITFSMAEIYASVVLDASEA